MDVCSELDGRSMKIAFDLRRIGNPGIGRYMKCLVEEILSQELDNDYLLIMTPDASGAIRSDSANVTRISARSRYYSVREQIELPRVLREHKVDLLHSPHFLLPLSRPCPTVVTIHDVVYIACPQDMPSQLGRLYYTAMMRASSHLATRIITDSIFSKNEIVRLLRVDPARVTVVYPAVDTAFRQANDSGACKALLAEYGIDREYILYAGIYKGRKNHAGLLRAFQYFLGSGGEAQMVIAGPMNDGEHQLRRLADELGIAEHVTFTGFITDSELGALYSGARVYACPSLYEGFGFTVLEAMACGAPVVCSDAASLPEVAGDAALYANPRNSAAFAEALYQVFTNEGLRQEMIERGCMNLRRFSWRQAATRSLATYSDALGIATAHPIAA
jgi:glycosyltransferase involved in cell wall biosynthesis